MATLTPCPHCNADIENDSVFCDQCGAELLQCPKCGKYRKGKFCTECGCPTGKPSGATAQPQQPAQQPDKQTTQQPVQPQQPVQQPVQPQQPIQQPQAPQYVGQPIQQPMARPTTNPPMGGTSIAGGVPAGGTSVAGGPLPSRLSCHTYGIILTLQPGAILGRVNGNYVAQLSSLNFISGTHGRFDSTPSGWTFTDLGSTNGTMVNGAPCVPHVPQALHIGDVVRIGKTYDFYVE